MNVISELLDATARSPWMVRQNLKGEKMCRYIDEDGIPFVRAGA